MASVASEEERRPLDFQDVGELDERARQEAIKAMGPILVKTFSRMNPSWSMPVHKPDVELRSQLEEWRKAVIDPVVGNPAIAAGYFDFILGMAEYCFSTVDLAQRKLICQINGVGVIMDDQIPKDAALRKEAESFLRNLTTGRPINSALLRNFGDLIREHSDMKTDPAIADYQWYSWLSFLIGTAFESRTGNILQALKQPLRRRQSRRIPSSYTKNNQNFTSSELPYFVRIKSGVSESWILSIFAQNGTHTIPMDMWLPIVPDVMLFMNLVNDLLSAPKEIVKAEADTYLNYQTYAKRQVGTPGSGSDGLWCFEDSFREACDSLSEIIARIDCMVAQRLEVEREDEDDEMVASQGVEDAEFVAKCWATFKAGIIEMHFDTKRYNASKWFPELAALRAEHRQKLAQAEAAQAEDAQTEDAQTEDAQTEDAQTVEVVPTAKVAEVVVQVAEVTDVTV